MVAVLNYSGKFDAHNGASPFSDGHGHVETITRHAGHAPSDAIIVPDSQLLFNGDFKRSGVDLVLSRDDHELVLHDYFKGEKRAPLSSPDGAHLTGDIVNALTGHTQFAQADGSASVGKVIGHVTKLTGTATATRNGVSIILNNGDNVEKGDVVQSGSDSTLGITFIDGTVFGLSANARMVLNEMVYDPNGSNNSSLLSLVAGTITFVAGETAKHGDMKIDTPVATMGIRGTAVLVEIDFNVPGQGGTPDAKFQVLVEPDGTTGSYILFDKTTLLPLMTVDQAGKVVSINNGNVSIGNALLSPEIQKLITDVFTLKFTDNSNPNTKTTSNQTDTLTPQAQAPIILASGTSATPVIVLLSNTQSSSSSSSSGSATSGDRIDGAPDAVIIDSSAHVSNTFAAAERDHQTGHSGDFDTASGKVNWVDLNKGDNPTLSTAFDSFVYRNAAHNNVTDSLNPLQLADVAAVEVQLQLVPDPSNNNNGSASWTYSVPDSAFDFLAAGETLTLTYLATVNNNFAGNQETTTLSFTITITGSNDDPVITTGPQLVTFAGGKSTPGGNLNSSVPTSGTLSFTDVDLTDTHTVGTKLTNASLSGPNASTLDIDALKALAPNPMAVFENALSALVATDSTGTGSGTVNWTLADIPVFLADFIPKGETLTLTYTVTVTDSQGAISTQEVTVTITGTDTPAVVWIATTKEGQPSGGLWSDASNWETGTVPTANDDAIIITNQLIGLTPSYPVTINSAAIAKTVTLDDFSNAANAHPQLINLSTLAIIDAFNINVDSIVDNSGTIGVHGAIELANHSILNNSGTLDLFKGGDFKDQSTVTNSGTLDLAGGTLNVLVNVANSGGTVTVGSAGTLKLTHATITGGSVGNSGEIDLTGGTIKSSTLNNGGQIKVSGTGNALDGDTFRNTGGVEVLGLGTLTLDQLTTVNNSGGSITIDATGEMLLEDATLTGGLVTNSGEIDLSGNGVVKSGTLSTSGLIKAGGGGNALDGETVTNTGGVEVLGLATLTVDQVSTISNAGGSITVDANGTLILNNATIVGGAVTDGGEIDFTGSGIIESGTLTNTGQIKVSGSANALDGEVVTNTGGIEVLGLGALLLDQGTGIANGGGTITVDSTGRLTLNGASITGGLVTDSGEIDLAGGGAIKSGTLNTSGLIKAGSSGNALDGETITNTGGIEVLGGGALLLDQGTSVTNGGGTITVDLSGQLTLDSASITGGTVTDNGTIHVTGDSAINSAAVNGGQVTVDAGKTLTLDNTTVTGTTITDNGTVKVDTGTTLTLSGTEIIGGAITDNGTIVVAGASKIDGTASAHALLNNGAVTVNAALTLDNVTVSGTTITDSNGSTIELDHNVTLTGGATLQGASPAAKGVISNLGTLEVAGPATLRSDTLTNTGHIVQVDATTLTLDVTEIIGGTINNGGTIVVAGASKIDGAAGNNVALNNGAVTVNAALTLDDVTVSGATITDSNGSTIELDHNVTLTGGAIIQGNSATNPATKGVISNLGTLQVTGAASLLNDTLTNTGQTVQVDASSTLTLSGTEIIGGTITDNGTIVVAGASKIDGTAGNNVALNNGAVTVNAALTLDDVTVSGTTITDSSSIELDNNVTLTGGATIQNGPITNLGTLEVAGLAMLLGDTLTNTGHTLQVDATTLTLDGTEIIGGDINNGGTIQIAGASKIDGTTAAHATLNNGAVAVNAKLTLDNVTVSGATITDSNGSIIELDHNVTLTDGAVIQGNSTTNPATKGVISNLGTLQVTGAASLLNDTLTNTGQTVQVDGSSTLTLSGTEIIGGTITDNGTIVVDGASKIDGTAGNNVALNNGAVTVNAALTLDDVTVSGTTITDSNGSTIELDHNVTLTDGAIIQGNSTTNPATKGVISNLGTLQVTGTASLLNDTLTNTGQTVQIDGSSTLTLSGTEIIGGTINDGGTIVVAGASKIDGAAGNNVALNNGAVTVNAALTLDDVTVSGTTITDSNGSTIELDGNVTLTGGAIIQGNSTTNPATKGVISNLGTLQVIGAASLLNDTLTNAAGAIVQVDASTTLTLDGTNFTGGTVTDNGTIEITTSSAINSATLSNGGVTVDADQTLTLNGTTVKGTVFTDTAAGAALAVGSGETLTLQDGADVIGGSLVNAGTVKIESSTGATLDGVDVDNTGGIVQVDQVGPLATLTLQDETTISHGTLSVGTTGKVDVATGATATLDGVGVTNDGLIEIESGGTLKVTGSITGLGSIHIDGGAVFELDGSDTQSIVFDGAGAGSGAELRIDGSSLGSHITGFDVGDELDLRTIRFDHNPFATYASATGLLTVTDGTNSITLTLEGHDYTHAHLASFTDGDNGTLILMKADDDAPVIAAGDKAQSGTVVELDNTTGSSVFDPSPIAGGSIHFTDIDLLDRPTAKITSQSVTWVVGDNTTNRSTLTQAQIDAIEQTLEQGLQLTQPGNTNNGAINWTYSIHDNSLDFLNAGETATIESTVTLNDQEGGTDTAVVTITIKGADDAPVGVNDSSTSAGAVAAIEAGGTNNGTAGLNATGNVLANDTDVDNTNASLTVSAVHTGATEGAGTAGTVGQGLQGAHGTLTLNNNGTYTYVVNDNDTAVQALNAGDTITDSFNYVVKDPGNLTDTAVLTITIKGADDAPVGVDDSSASTGAVAAIEAGGTNNGIAGSNATGNVLTNDTDVDNTNLSLAVSAVRTGSTEGSGTAGTVGFALHGAHGTLTLNSTGTYTYVVDNTDTAVQALNAGDTLTDSFNYTVKDPGNLTDIAVLTITINGANDAPVGVNDTSASTGAVAAIEAGGTNNGTAGLNATGNVLANDTDVDNTNLSLAVSAVRTGATEGSGTSGTVGHGLQGAHGTLTLSSTGTYTYVVNDNDPAVQILNAGQSITDSFNYTVKDPGNLTDTAVLTITINGADDAPVGVNDSSTSTGATAATEAGGVNNGTPGSNAAGNVLTNDTDIDNTTASLAVSAVRTGATEGSGTSGTVGQGLQGAHGTLTLSSTGTYTYVVNNNDPAVQALGAGQTITDTFNYTVKDPGNLTDTAVLTITINGANDAPAIVTGSTTATGAFNAGSEPDRATGSIAFTDPELADTHTVSVGGPTFSLSGGTPNFILNFLFASASNLTLTGTDSTGTGTGSVGWNYSLADFLGGDLLSPGQKLTVTYTVTIADNHGASTHQDIVVTVTGGNGTDPAGVAGSAINLGLAQVAGVSNEAVTVTGAPLNWSMAGAAHNADGSWTTLTSDLSALTITPDVNFVGAAHLHVTETWTNADGSAGSMVVSDNVVAYAPDAPIFAVAGNDHLTGTANADFFVVAQPIGSDIIYNFDAASDKIDLIGFDGVTDFTDIQGSIADDANGNAVITLGPGETVTLNGVHAASVTANDFVFNQTPVTENPGTMHVGDGAHLSLSGTIDNTGTIELASTGDLTGLQLIQHGITLMGGGDVVLSDSAENAIRGTADDVTLTNVDNTISGSGQIGAGHLTLVNEGTIDATGANALTIDTGVNAITNSGTLEATGSGGLIIHSDIVNTGVLWANGGNVTVDGNVSGNGSALISGSATLELAGASTENAVFTPGSSGILMLDHAFDFKGAVSGMTSSNHLDLLDFNFASGPALNYIANADGTGGTLSVTDGAHTANIALLGQFDLAGFQIGADHGAGTLISYHHDGLLV